MAESKKVYVYEEQFPEIEVVTGIDRSLRIYGEDSVVRIYEPGAQGPPGPQGPQGFSGAGEPFYVITSGSLYATTASLANFASFSSSLLPWTRSLSETTFDLGSLFQPWRKVFVGESIGFVKSGSLFVEIKASQNQIEIGQSIITTSSFGFDNYIVKRITSDQQQFLIQSASVSHSINSQGVFSVGDFDYLPTPIPGGIIKSGSNFYFGI